MAITVVSGFEHREEIRELFTEYTKMLVETSPAFAEYLKLQRYDDEVEHLEKKYGPPGGRLFLALADRTPAGCIALRPLDAERCELKRLYVRDAYRRRGLGERLVRLLLDEAGAIGYRQMLLDTRPDLQTAQRLYLRLGFRTIPRYNDSPLDDTVYLGRDL